MSENTRNFCIIAHIDHGKTTLSDRLLEATKSIEERDKKDQLLDSMDLEREKGITIKSHPVTMSYQLGETTYKLNLLDTPGHVDFSYEVSRSLAACEGALLLIDSSQGIEAQTVANLQLAMEHKLKIIPIINKIDLPGANPEKIRQQMEEVLCIPAEEAIEASGKTGKGVEEILTALISRIPAPKKANQDEPLCGLIFDSVYDTYRGVISYIRVISGTLKAGEKIKLFATEKSYEIKEIGIFTPQMSARKQLTQGDVGYFIANMKSTSEVKIGDTITSLTKPIQKPLKGFQEIQAMVYAGIYPIESSEFENLKVAISKLQINDAALTYTAENSVALGFGFRCGFLGLLHMEIVQERLRREFNMDIISTYPSVVYEITLTDGSEISIDNPCQMPDTQKIAEIREPIVQASIIIPNENIGELMQLIMSKRGEISQTETLDDQRVLSQATMPLNEILVDFNDKLKSMTKGFGSMNYEHSGYQAAKLVKMDILISGDIVDAFSVIVHREKAESHGRKLAEKLKEIIPQQLFSVAIQAAIGGKIIARETISAIKKNVTAKCYGGDISRKRKLLEKQKAGKKKMKAIGSIQIPQDAFIKVLKND